VSRWQYDPKCPGCRPVAVDLQTGVPCAPDHPLVKVMDELWEKATPMTRTAFHHVTCLNSRAILDLALAKSFMDEVQERASKV
jgi:hypothetical protein